MLDILGDKVEFNFPGGGLNFYLKLSEKVKTNSIELFYECRDKNVLITPGVLFYKNHTDGERYFRLGFSKTDSSEIEKGIKIINNILETSDMLG
jgi:DNA-binding transcriptional MocR family regulator